MTRGLVLGGGGITGIAWMTGLVAGLAEAGLDVRDADLVVGTSAGSVVGAQLRSATPVEELYAYQATPYVPRPDERVASISPSVLVRYAGAFLRGRGDSRRMCRALGAYAVTQARAGRTPSLEERYAAIRERLPSLAWPERPLTVTAVDVATGELRGLTADSGVDLLEAVAASCAVPGVYPPVPIRGRDHVDGGARSYVNADLARDCERVLVLAPVDRAIGPMRRAREQLAGVRHEVIRPDEASRTAIGRNVLDPARRHLSAEAGRAQAAAIADRVRALWAE